MNEFITLLQLLTLTTILLIAFTILFVVITRKIRMEITKREIRKYFGIFKEDDEQYQYFQDSLEASRKGYIARKFDFTDGGQAEYFKEREAYINSLGNHEVDDEIKEFHKSLEENKKNFSSKPISFIDDELNHICQPCGKKLLEKEVNKGKKQNSISTWYFGVCDDCQTETVVTESRDFGYPINK